MNRLIFFLFIIPLTCFSQEYKGTVLWVIDGDTFIFQTEEGNIKVRMFGIDAPEKSQEFGKESKEFLEKYLHKIGIVQKTGVDKYGRMLGVLYINKININLESIKNGCAWHYSYYYKSKEFEDAQKEAKEKRLGLWKNSNPIPPWAFRKESNQVQNHSN